MPYCGTDAARWTGQIHISFFAEVMRRIDREFTEDNPAPQVLRPYITALTTAYGQEDAWYVTERKQELTERIAKEDTDRDVLLRQLRTMVTALTLIDAWPEKQNASKLMQRLLDVYDPDPHASYDDETTQIAQWHQTFIADADQVAAAELLGLTDLIAALVAKNTLVRELISERNDIYAAQTEVDLKAARQQTDYCYEEFRQVLNAVVITDSHPERFTAFVMGLTQEQKTAQENYESYQRANKRVQVKSDIVGNHFYKVVAGWTWAKIAQENPKALAMDPEPTAPGVEPVVVPQRIISLDKEAKKAGGLAVAPKDGPIVRPNDEVNPAKTYVLVPYAAQ